MLTTDTLSVLGITAVSRVLVVMPHPDDEAIFCGGFLHKLSVMAIPTRVITMTLGEKSTLRYNLKPEDDLAGVRQKELTRALSILGIRDFQIYHYPDGGLENIGEKVIQAIRTNIQDFRPTHVATLEPDGIYGHPDHIALCTYTTYVVRRPTRLLYVTVSPSYRLPKSSVKMAKKTVIKPIEPDVELQLSWRDISAKLKTLRAHNSQFMGTIGTIVRSLTLLFINRMTANEFFAWGN
jgi:LmbE family N-acetylglucosaminyl deacetylase